MRITGVSWTGFRLPLRAPFETARGCVSHREGVLLRLATSEGVVGVGEASPHVPAETGALRAVEEALAGLAPQLIGADVDGLESSLLECVSGPVACAVDTALLDAMGRARCLPLARLLVADVAPSVAVNATVAVASDSETALAAASARAAGFQCVKLKVGMAPGLEAERRRAAAVREALGPDVALRLDANGAWTEQQAVAAIDALAELRLELVEQPLPPGDPEAMARLRARVEVPIAVDEDVTDPAAAERLLEAGAADALVVKPMAVGGPRLALAIAEAAKRAGVSVVVTTTIDSGVGVTAALHLAAALGEGGLAHGLATSGLLAADIVEPPLAVEGGHMALPEAPGLGVEVDDQALRRHGLGDREVRG